MTQAAIQEVYEFIKAAETYYLATVDGDQPRVRPFGTIELFAGRLYIQTGLRKDVAKQIQVNPKVELSAFKDGIWVRLRGTLVHDPDVEAQAHMLAAYPILQDRYAVDDGNNAVFYFVDAAATFFSFSDEPRLLTL